MFYTHDYEQKKYISEPHFMISIMVVWGCLGPISPGIFGVMCWIQVGNPLRSNISICILDTLL